MGDDGEKQLELNFSTTDITMYARTEGYDTPPSYDATGLPFKTLDEFERHYYITNNEELHSLWSMVSDLEDALAMAAKMSL